MRRKEAKNRTPTSQVIVEGDMIIPVTSNNPKKVERITPSAQSEIDKKSYRALDLDFGVADRIERTPEKKRRVEDTEKKPKKPVSKLVKTRSVKALNKWGMDKQSLDSLTESEKRRFSFSKQ